LTLMSPILFSAAADKAAFFSVFSTRLAADFRIPGLTVFAIVLAAFLASAFALVAGDFSLGVFFIGALAFFAWALRVVGLVFAAFAMTAPLW